MVYYVKSPELKEIADVSMQIMREARKRQAHLKFDKLALEGGRAVVNSRRQDLVERLNAERLTEMEARVVDDTEPKPKRVEKK